MRTSNYTVDDVEHFAHYFAVLSFDPKATRSLHAQATSFYWSDEMPEFVADDYPASLRHFMIWLLSYRKVLMYGERVPEFEPLWNRLIELCPSWPGFIAERKDQELIEELEKEVDEMLDLFAREITARKRCKKEQQEFKSPTNPRTT